MIEPNELRVGNLVLLESSIVTVLGVDSLSSFNILISDDCYGNDEIDPIPITPEWLERLGFLPYPFNGGWRHDSSWLEIDNMGGYFQYPHGCSEIKYIHQLQNLYFALTGNELTDKDANTR